MWRRLPGVTRVPRSLGAKLMLIVTGVGLLGSLAISLLLASVITPHFTHLERQLVIGRVERAREALKAFAREVETAVRDHGDWNASYDDMAQPTPAFESGFSTPVMANLGIDGIAYIGNDGRVVAARWLDRGARRDVPGMRARLVAAVPALALPRLLANDRSRGFYLRFGNTLAAVGVARVRRSDGSGAPRGYVLMARQLTSARMATLLRLPASIDLADPGRRTGVTAFQGRLGIAVPIVGADGRPVASAAFSIPRDLSTLGRRMLLLAVAGVVVLLLVVLLVLSRVITRLVLRPLHRVERHMEVVRTSGTLGLLTDDRRADEIGSLVTSFNAMLSQLKDLRERLEVQSFKLGQSESAVAVMHNVRNALNPVGTILSQRLTAAPALDLATVARALAELAGDDAPPARRRTLAAFVAAAAQADTDDRIEHRRQLEVGRKALHNVLEIIGRQQEQADEKPVLGACNLSDIVAQNAAIACYSGSASIAFAFPGTQHRVLANRLILSQVVGNLLANAAEAIVAGGEEGGSITATIVKRGASVELVIRDNGEGFDAEHETRFFQRGFSTRAHKAGGLGLHWCANAMIAMGGALRLESDGKGKGARAVLTLPADGAPAQIAA